MVAIRSESGDESALAEFLTEQMDQLGFDAQIDDAGNAVGTRGEGDIQVVLLGHMDTVSGGPEVRLEDEILYGRGTVDAKGPLATLITAAANADLPRDVQVTVIGAVEEEIHTSKGSRAVIDEYRPNFCIIGEPSGWDGMTIGYKGRILIDFTVQSDTGHPAAPQLSPADAAFGYWSDVQEYLDKTNASKSRIFHQVQSRITAINTNMGDNQDRVDATFAFRIPPDINPKQFIKDLQDWHQNSGELTLRESVPGYLADRQTPLHRSFLGAIRSEGGKPKFKVKSGTSDMNIVGPVWQCPLMAYGPGDSNLDHTPKEQININEYRRSIGILTEVLETITRGIVA